MTTGPITVTIHFKRRRMYRAAMFFFSVCTMLGMSSDRAARAVIKLGYRITVDDR